LWQFTFKAKESVIQMARYDEALQQLRDHHGAQFDDLNLDPRFIPYFNSGERILVAEEEGSEEYAGTVGLTNGPHPIFTLNRIRIRVAHSMIELNTNTVIRAVWDGQKYNPIA
jgi:hypothetical protein